MEGVTTSDPGDCFLDSPAAAAVSNCSQSALHMRPTYKHSDAHRKKCRQCQGLDAFFMDEGFKVPT